MYEFFGVSRAACYAWVKHLEQTNPDAERKLLIQEAYEKSHRIYGYHGLLYGSANIKAFPLITKRFCGFSPAFVKDSTNPHSPSLSVRNPIPLFALIFRIPKYFTRNLVVVRLSVTVRLR